MSQWSYLYQNRRWRKKRAALLQAEPLCRMCKQDGRVEVATVADHVEPHKGDLGLFWNGRLQPLCKTHHDSAKAKEEGSGVVVGHDAQGIPIDASHHWRD